MRSSLSGGESKLNTRRQSFRPNTIVPHRLYHQIQTPSNVHPPGYAAKQLRDPSIKGTIFFRHVEVAKYNAMLDGEVSPEEKHAIMAGNMIRLLGLKA
jgi:hypothetical protein